MPLNDGDDSSIVAAGTHNLGENVTYEQTGIGGKGHSYKIVGDNIDKNVRP